VRGRSRGSRWRLVVGSVVVRDFGGCGWCGGGVRFVVLWEEVEGISWVSLGRGGGGEGEGERKRDNMCVSCRTGNNRYSIH